MPYTATNWIGGTTATTQTNMNHLETQYAESTNSFEQDVFSAGWTYSGIVCTKDGTTANQLDVTAGVSFLLQTDGTFRRRATIASTTSQFVTSTFSTTYYLDLNPDGTWSWGTSHSAVTNHLTICSVATDGSGNISSVTDARGISPTMFPNLLGRITLPSVAVTGIFKSDGTHIATDGSGNFTAMGNITFGGSPILSSLQSGSATGITFEAWTGTANAVVLSIGSQLNSAKSWFDSNGYLYLAGQAGNGLINSQLSGGSTLGVAFRTWSGSASIYPFSIGAQVLSALSWVDKSGNYNGPIAGGLPVTRNGVASSVPIYTGTTSPSSPPTGSIWIDA